VKLGIPIDEPFVPVDEPLAIEPNEHNGSRARSPRCSFRWSRAEGAPLEAAALAKGAGQESNGHFYDFDYPVVGDDGEETRERVSGSAGHAGCGMARRDADPNGDQMTWPQNQFLLAPR